MGVDFSRFGSDYHTQPDQYGENLAAYAEAINSGSVDARSRICKTITPLNLFGCSKFAIDKHRVGISTKPIPLETQTVLDTIGYGGTATSVANAAFSALNVVGCTAAWATQVAAVTTPIGVAITVAQIGMRTYMLINGAWHQTELWEKNGYQLFPTPIGEARIDMIKAPEVAAAGCCCGLMALQFEPCSANEGGFFSAEHVAILRQNGFLSTSMHQKSNSIAYRNAFTGECFVIMADKPLGKIFFMATVMDGIVGSEAGVDRSKAVTELYSEEDQKKIDRFIEKTSLSGNLEAAAVASGLSVDDLKRAIAIKNMRSRRAKFAYGQTATLAIVSGAVEPACMKSIETAFKITLAACAKRGVAKDSLVLTGLGLDGTIAQALALKYGFAAHCFAPLPIGATLQNVVGFQRIAQNAPVVHNYALQCSGAAEVGVKTVDGLAYTLLGLQTPGVFGCRHSFQAEGVTKMTASNVEAVALNIAHQIVQARVNAASSQPPI